MNLKPGFTFLVTLAIPSLALALASCSSSVIGGDGGSTSSSTGAGGGASSASGDVGGASSSISTTGAGSSTSSGSSTTSTSSTSSGGGGACSGANVGLPAAACTPPDPSCNTQIAECLPLHHNAGAASFGLRMADLSLTAPPALTKGLVKGVLVNGITPAQAVCNLNGAGTFSWLLQFDSAAGTIKTGGAKPPANPALGYSFVDQNFPVIGGMLHVAPVTLTGSLDAACSGDSSAGDLTLPIYLDSMGTQVFLLPIQQVKFVNLTVSGNHDCIGKFNAAGLDPASGCIADAQHPTFFPDAQVTGLINLEQADTVTISQIGQSLCTVLSGDAATYGDGGSPTSRCKRVGGQIVFQGDWCTATNQPATPQCKDALYFAGGFAASGVIIN